MKKNAYTVLKERGFINKVSVDGKEMFHTTDEGAVTRLLSSGTTVYQGFDPSADSLHLGHFMGIMALHHIQEAGNRVIFLLGGATGRIGDPSGKITSRVQLSKEQVTNNGEAIRKQVQNMGLLDFASPDKALMLNNSEWVEGKLFLEEYLMGIASKFSVNDMVKMETFGKKLEEGISLSLLEFLYATVQAWDFLELYEKYGCKIQVGGSDQWGNILQGVNLIKSRLGNEADPQGITFKLLLTPSGQKMGKTEKGPLWLDKKKTSPFDFYQYIEKIPDQMVGELFGIYTFLPMEEIEEIMRGKPREIQKRLAYEITKVVHGPEEAEKAEKHSMKIFSESDKTEGIDSIPEITIKRAYLLDELLVESNSLKSKAEVLRRVDGGAIRIDDSKVADPKVEVNRTCLIRFGKTSFLRVKKYRNNSRPF